LTWEIGNTTKNRKQFINKDYIAISNNNSLSQMKERPNSEVVKDVTNVILNNKDKVNIIEKDLSIMFKDTNNLFQRCIDMKSRSHHCMEIYKVMYGTDWVFIVEQILIHIPK
jgi:hypothetical protein